MGGALCSHPSALSSSGSRLQALREKSGGVPEKAVRGGCGVWECRQSMLCGMHQVSQHRDVIQTEYARVNVAKSKLENLCRELQKHSKAVAVSC